VAQYPSNTQWQRDLSASYRRRGDIYCAEGVLADALVLYQQSIEILRQLVAIDSSNTRWLRALLVSHIEVESAYQDKGDSELALASFRSALAVNKRLLALALDNAEWQQDGDIIQQSLEIIISAAD
jgi:tetratricopeptide (TPR) repeat protein